MIFLGLILSVVGNAATQEPLLVVQRKFHHSQDTLAIRQAGNKWVCVSRQRGEYVLQRSPRSVAVFRQLASVGLENCGTLAEVVIPGKKLKRMKGCSGDPEWRIALDQLAQDCGLL